MTTAIYGNSIYSLLNDAPSWTIANDTAKESGGEMMTINTLNEYYFGQKYLWGSAELDAGTYHFIGFNKDNETQTYTWSSGETTDWDSDPTILIHRQNWDTQQAELAYWDYGILSTADDGFSYEEYGNSFGRVVMTDDTASFYRNRGDTIYAVYEYDLNLLLNTPASVEEGIEFTVDINLTAGTTGSELTQGSTIWYTYEITGVDGNGESVVFSVTGSGLIDANGQFDDGDSVLGLQITIDKDWVFDDDQFRLTFYSDDPSGTGSELGFTDAAAYRDAIQIDIDQAEGSEIIDGVVVADIVDPTPPAVIGIANGDAEKMVIFGDLVNDPNVQSYTVVEETKGKKSDRQSLTTFDPVLIDPQGPLNALVVNGDNQDNYITAQSFSYTDSDGITSSTGGFDASSGALVINGMGGSDTIFSATAGVTWMIGGGVSQSNGIDTLTGNSLTQEVYDLRKEDETNPGIWEDAYSMGHAVINGFDAADFVVLSGTNYDIINKTITTEVTKGNGKGGKTRTETTTHFEIYDTSGVEPDLIAMVYGPGFTQDSSIDQYIITGQTTDPFKVVLPGNEGGTII